MIMSGISEKMKPRNIGLFILLVLFLSFSILSITAHAQETNMTAKPGGSFEQNQTIDIPFMGKVDLSSMSLGVSTGLIAFVDGLNPCSLWVITFLLGLVIYSGSRKKIAIVGLTFLLTTSAAYGAFIVGLINVFNYVGQLFWIRLGVAALAFTFAIVNIKDFFWYKKGISFTISDRYKPKIIGKMRGVLKEKENIPVMIFATAAMALGIVLVELPCTAGFPVIWTNMMANRGLGMLSFTFIGLLFLYLFIYLCIELAVFFSAIISMDKAKLQKKEGRFLKLLGGTIMFALALSMLFAPDLMESITGTLYVFGGAVFTALVIKWIYGKRKGSEDEESENKEFEKENKEGDKNE